ncbi:MAG: recombinase family protein [Candidatus Thermoplasmatota archaeon]|nr:recombinase family protein [Candidatus Thermoplasmatota archaeon]
MKRVTIYTRVSTEDQAKEGFSLDAQMEKLKSYCNARGWEIVKECIDNGYSGRDINRPAYKKMMEEIDEWDVLLVMKMDRIHRNSKNFMLMMENLNENGKEFVSMTESLDTSTAMGRFVMDIIQRIAQLESEQIGERVYVGMRQKAKDGKGILGSPAPYGYDYKDGHFVEIKDEMEIVKKIYEMYLDGKPLEDISKWLKKRGVTTKRGGKWNKKTVSRILSNPIYCGLIEWEDIIAPGNHGSTIDIEEFNKVQKIKHERARRKGKNFVISDSLKKEVLS